jgi:hypothetical protein
MENNPPTATAPHNTDVTFIEPAPFSAGDTATRPEDVPQETTSTTEALIEPAPFSPGDTATRPEETPIDNTEPTGSFIDRGPLSEGDTVPRPSGDQVPSTDVESQTSTEFTQPDGKEDVPLAEKPVSTEFTTTTLTEVPEPKLIERQTEADSSPMSTLGNLALGAALVVAGVKTWRYSKKTAKHGKS